MKKTPDFLLKRIQKELGPDGEIEFSKYVYVPKTLEDKRLVSHVQLSEAENWFKINKNNLDKNQDIALHSICRDSEGNFFHIPMVDFYGDVSKKQFENVSRILRNYFKLKEFYLFSSGRSYHLYAFPFLELTKFNEFLGVLLLLNTEKFYFVDSRWVGHRLLAGYTALRWTSNNLHYSQVPSLKMTSMFIK